MAEINLDDLQDDLISDVGLTQDIVDAPFIDEFVEEQDEINLYDLAPDIYENPHGKIDDGIDKQNSPQEEVDIISDLLKSKGIEDPTQVNYEDESGQIQKVNFYELPYEDQLEILTSNDADIDYGLDSDESEAISFLRENQVTLPETIEYFQRKAVEDYINSQNISGLEVDQYSNEELYVLHLKSEYPDLTEEEIGIALQKQQEHPDLFRKQVDKLRTDYKEIEQKQIDDAKLEITQVEENKRKELEDTLIDIATSIKDIGGLTLDDGDRNQVLDYILNKDMQGISPFVKSLNSPEKIFKLAWFEIKGNEAFDIIHDYYKKEIAQVSKASFEKGKLSAQGAISAKPTQPKVSYTRKGTTATPPQYQPPAKNEGMSINDITID